jgi:endonuclease/exonuclease/phosphatase family metal-dependent hydrolase
LARRIKYNGGDFMNWINVLELCGEGGSITLQGRKNENGTWSFKRLTNESAMADLLSEEDAEGLEFKSESKVVEGWDNAIKMLSKRYPHWANLYPTELYPEFADSVIQHALSQKRCRKDIWEEELERMTPSLSVISDNLSITPCCSEESKYMRIATWNLDHAYKGNRQINLQIQQIKNIGPGIIVLTETCENVDLSQYGYNVALPSNKNKHGKYWTTVWSKYPIVNQLPTHEPDTAVCAEIDSPIGKILIYGTIIPYHLYNAPPAWDAHYKAIRDHGNNWARLLHETSNKLPLIVAGDFNQTRDNSVGTYGTKKGRELLSDELSRNGLTCLTTENFGVTGKLKTDPQKGWARNNIDHICMTENAFRVVRVGAWDHFTDSNKYMSDHNGVYVDLA